MNQKYTIEDATHYLMCRHCVGRHCREYTMKCIVLGQTKQKVRVIVFGNRYWKGNEHKKTVRYVDGHKLIEIQK